MILPDFIAFKAFIESGTAKLVHTRDMDKELVFIMDDGPSVRISIGDRGPEAGIWGSTPYLKYEVALKPATGVISDCAEVPQNTVLHPSTVE